MKIQTKLLLTCLIAGSVLVAYGAEITFSGAGGDGGLILNTANWTGGVVPLDSLGHTGVVGAGKTVRGQTSDNNRRLRDFTLTFNSNAHLVPENTPSSFFIKNVDLTFNDTSTFFVGTYFNHGQYDALVPDTGTGTKITINDNAALALGSQITLRHDDGAGVAFQQNGGTVTTTGNLKWLSYDLGAIAYNFAGGTLNIGAFNADGVADTIDEVEGYGHTFNFQGTGGTLNVSADYTSVLNTLIGSGEITLDGASATTGDFTIGFNNGITTMTVIPEPATLVMIAALGGGMFFVRRKFMI